MLLKRNRSSIVSNRTGLITVLSASLDISYRRKMLIHLEVWFDAILAVNCHSYSNKRDARRFNHRIMIHTTILVYIMLGITYSYACYEEHANWHTISKMKLLYIFRGLDLLERTWVSNYHSQYTIRRICVGFSYVHRGTHLFVSFRFVK